MESRLSHAEIGDPKDGIMEIHLPKWELFFDLVHELLKDFQQFVYRGQRVADWKLESSLDRLERQVGRSVDRSRHLMDFQWAARGRRGPNPPKPMDENDWWALGQHYQLATPLLDWTESPFVAAYFAFQKESTQGEPRAVFALNRLYVGLRSVALENEGKAPMAVTIHRPWSDEDPRVISQRGLFTKLPERFDLESWVRKFPLEYKDPALIKVTIPNAEREDCLRDLNCMNINHLTLFPDLSGVALYCNTKAAIPKY